MLESRRYYGESLCLHNAYRMLSVSCTFDIELGEFSELVEKDILISDLIDDLILIQNDF